MKLGEKGLVFRLKRSVVDTEVRKNLVFEVVDEAYQE